MQPNASHQQQFYTYLFQKIVQDGGLRLQVIASEVGTLPLRQSTNCRPNTRPSTLSTSTASNTAI